MRMQSIDWALPIDQNFEWFEIDDGPVGFAKARSKRLAR